MTQQVKDRLKYDGQIYLLEIELLADFLEHHPDLKPTPKFISTDNWKAYVATFKLDDLELMLESVSIEGPPQLEKAFLDRYQQLNGSMQLSGFSGIICLYKSKLEGNFSVADYNRYAAYHLLEVQQGILNDEKEFDHEGLRAFKTEQLKLFVRSEAYQKAKQEYITNLEQQNEAAREVRGKRSKLQIRRFDEDAFRRHLEEYLFTYTGAFWNTPCNHRFLNHRSPSHSA